MNVGRIDRAFSNLRNADRAGLVAYVSAGDPDFDTSLRILQGLPDAGADLIELGMPFTDPMADGPTVQAASLRALESGMSLERTLELVEAFRKTDRETPIVLMGYYNPIYSYGNAAFLKNARTAGVDGLIIVDLPAEEDTELCTPAIDAGLNWIRLATPTTRDSRLPAVLSNTSGFVYYVSIKGVTGTGSADTESIEAAVTRLKQHTDLPIAVGFGIRTPEQAADVARVADAVVLGSAFCQVIADHAEAGATQCVHRVHALARELSRAIRMARS